jgi:hypothetical protein
MAQVTTNKRYEETAMAEIEILEEKAWKGEVKKALWSCIALASGLLFSVVGFLYLPSLLPNELGTGVRIILALVVPLVTIIIVVTPFTATNKESEKKDN